MNISNLVSYGTFNLSKKFKKILEPIISIANDMGSKLYIFGGFLRDLLDNKMPTDGDIYVEGRSSSELTSELLRKGIIKKKKDYIGPISMKEDIQVVLSETVIYDIEFDFVSSDLANIEDYLKRTDFTINTLYYDLQTNKLFDPTGRGISDIKNRILYPNSNMLTPLEVLRTVKFVILYNYTLDPKTVKLINIVAPDLVDVNVGLATKILQRVYNYAPEKTEKLMSQLGILDYIPDYIFESIKNKEVNYV